MNYAVIWRPNAEQELAQIWLDATDRAAVTASSNRIDQLLGGAPVSQGQWLFGATRALIVRPLAVVYEVVEDDKRVYVLTTWREE